MLLAGSLAIHHGLPSHGNLIKNECVALNVHLYLKLFCIKLTDSILMLYLHGAFCRLWSFYH
jgi:hypothetical protein